MPTFRISIICLAIACQSFAAAVHVRNTAELRSALSAAVPGTMILLAPGRYQGGFHSSRLRGETNRPIVIAAATPAQRPVLEGGAAGIHLTDAAFVEIRDLTIASWTGNGLSIDDGGTFDSPAHGIVISGVVVTNVGLQGNRDGIKLSGVVDFRVERSVVEGWGTGGGSGIDMVGCHRGLIISNTFRHTDSVGSTGVQCKGGSSRIRIERNRFENAGGRGVNIGGSTGRKFFRPALRAAENHEAKDITVVENVFIGSAAAMAFVGVDGATVRSNTIYLPKRWVFRILQETRDADFVPCRNGEFSDNAIVFNSSMWSERGVNVGGGTAPGTFKFARNRWYCVDQPMRSKPRLPTAEVGGVYGERIDFRP